MSLHPNDLAHLQMTQRDWDRLPAEKQEEWIKLKSQQATDVLLVVFLVIVVSSLVAWVFLTHAPEPVSAAQPASAWAKHGGEGIGR